MLRKCLEGIAAISVLGLVTGCGGGSSGGGTGGGGTGGGNPTTVTFAVGTPAPTVIATQAGTGQFTTATVNSGKVALAIPSGTTKFAVAYACPSQTLFAVTLSTQMTLEATTLDGNNFSLFCPSANGPTAILTGTVDASAFNSPNESLEIIASNGSWVYGPGPLNTPNFSAALPSGTDRVALVIYDFSNPNNGTNILAVKNFDNQTVPGVFNGGSTAVIGSGDQVTQQLISLENIPSGFSSPSVTSFYEWSNGGSFVTSQSTTQYPVLPAGATEAGDRYLTWAVSINGTNPAQQVDVWSANSTPSPLTISFPSPWPYAGPTPAASPSFDLNYSGFGGTSGTYREVLLDWNSSSTSENQSQVFVSGNYLGDSTTVTFPDLSGLTGFAQAPISGTSVNWGAEILQSTFPAWQLVPANQTLTAVSNGGTYTVP
ncbi:MAG TPA: hypothetical protein VK716_18050 [Terracidiphilus sp.]|jgi:hypothetical protein|nr:hypothetical protein [Terracidiphilus sp.]